MIFRCGVQRHDAAFFKNTQTSLRIPYKFCSDTSLHSKKSK